MIQQTNNIPAIYTEAAETIKTAILQGQYEALKGENRIQLAVYYSVGKYVSQNSRKGKWGTGALASIAITSERYSRIARIFCGKFKKNEVVL